MWRNWTSTRDRGPPPELCLAQVAKALSFLRDHETRQEFRRQQLGPSSVPYALRSPKRLLRRVLICRLVSQELKQELEGGLP